MKLICPYCNYECDEDSIFCSGCGKKIYENKLDSLDSKLCLVDQYKNIYEIIDVRNKKIYTKEQEKLVFKYKKIENAKRQKEKKTKKRKNVLKVLWIIFVGASSAINFSIFGVLSCLTIFGIPLGITLFKAVPLAFNPIGKRVKTNFSKRPFLNLAWIFLGGWLIGVLFEIYIIILFISIIGIPIAIKMQKISKIFFAPFGAQIVKEDSFSDEITEKVAYTIKYVRKNRLNVYKEDLIDDTVKDENLERLTNPSVDVNIIFQKEKFWRYIIPLILLICLVITVKGFEFFSKIIIVAGVGSLVNDINNFFLPLISLINNMYFKLLSTIPINTTFFVEHMWLTIIIFFVLFIGLIVLIISILNHFLDIKNLKRYNYGYMTRRELITLFDNNKAKNYEIEDTILKVYETYQEEIDKEILEDI